MKKLVLRFWILVFWLGCVHVDPVQAESDQPLKIVTSIEPLALIARDIGGDKVEVTRLLPANGSPHHFQLKPSHRKLIAKSDLLLWVGPGMETALARVAPRLLAQKQLAWIAEGDEENTEHEEQGDHHNSHNHHHDKHSEEYNEHHEEERHDRSHGHGGGHNVSHEEGEELHPWIDPGFVSTYIDRVVQRFSELAPSSAEFFNQRGQVLKKALREQDKQLKVLFLANKHSGIIVDHNGYDSFVAHYGVTQLGSIRGSGHQSPGAGHLGRLHALAPTMVVTSQGKDVLAERLAEKFNVPLVNVDLLAVDKAYPSFSHYFRYFSEQFLP